MPTGVTVVPSPEGPTGSEMVVETKHSTSPKLLPVTNADDVSEEELQPPAGAPPQPKEAKDTFQSCIQGNPTGCAYPGHGQNASIVANTAPPQPINQQVTNHPVVATTPAPCLASASGCAAPPSARENEPTTSYYPAKEFDCMIADLNASSASAIDFGARGEAGGILDRFKLERNAPRVPRKDRRPKLNQPQPDIEISKDVLRLGSGPRKFGSPEVQDDPMGPLEPNGTLKPILRSQSQASSRDTATQSGSYKQIHKTVLHHDSRNDRRSVRRKCCKSKRPTKSGCCCRMS